MSVLGSRRSARQSRTNRFRGLVSALLATTVAAGCDVPFDPIEENTIGPFAVFGYLDMMADTQWVRVMPVRQQMFSDPGPIDAVVTLEHLGSGRVVTLRDSLFAFADLRLGGVSYAHNFWTTEPIEPEATYRLVARRSDGAVTTAVVETPDLEATLEFREIPETPGVWEPRQVSVEAEHLLYHDVLYSVWDLEVDRGVPPVRTRRAPRTTSPGRWEFGVPSLVDPRDRLDEPTLIDVLRREARVAVATSDWPYEPGLSATEIAIPGAVPTTVENGVGSLVGVAMVSVPLPFCMPVEARLDGRQDCTTVFDESSTAVVGRVTLDPCRPRQLTTVLLTERYADGGAVVWEWKADWDGTYHFEGLRPGSELRVEFEDRRVGAVQIPPLGAGERYVVPDVTLPDSCLRGGAARGARSRS